jgi:cold shock CspA family protein
MKGYLDYWNAEKRYGFIKTDDGRTFFVHISNFPEGAKPVTGNFVSFDEGRTSKGPIALNVQIEQPGSGRVGA